MADPNQQITAVPERDSTGGQTTRNGNGQHPPAVPMPRETRVSESPRKPGNQAALDLLQSWLDEGEYVEFDPELDRLKAELDEDRLSARKLFP